MSTSSELSQASARQTGGGPVGTLSFALYRSGEVLALCGADIGEVITEVCRGFRRGRSLADAEGDGR